MASQTVGRDQQVCPGTLLRGSSAILEKTF